METTASVKEAVDQFLMGSELAGSAAISTRHAVEHRLIGGAALA